MANGAQQMYGDPGANAYSYPGGVTSYNAPAAPAPWNFWDAYKAFLGEDLDADQWGKLSGYFQGNKRWRAPRYAQDMMTMAGLLKDLGMEDEGNQLAMSILGQGWQRPRWNLDIFAGAMSPWGMGIGGGGQQRRQQQSPYGYGGGGLGYGGGY